MDIDRLTRWQKRPPASEPRKYVIGFSQATTVEPWRVQFNVDIRREAAAEEYSNFDLLIKDGEDNVDKQIADIEYFMKYPVDALLISPKEAARLTTAALRAIDAGIPVFVLDRNLNTKKQRSFIRGDNLGIGEKAGEYAAGLLRPFKKYSKKVIFEIWGGLGTEASRDRSKGFHEELKRKLGDDFRKVQLLPEQNSADWKQNIAYDVMTKAIRRHRHMDLVYCHNDAMAYGAYLAATELSRGEIKFIGVDGLISQGKAWVKEGWLAATFVYPTPGAEGLRQAKRFLLGGEPDQDVLLPRDKNDIKAVLKTT